MNKKVFLMAAIAAVFAVQQASAGIVTFSKADLLSLEVDGALSTLFTIRGADDLTEGTYDDGLGDTNVMNGLAGSNESLEIGGAIYYTLTGAELAAFNALTGTDDDFEIAGFNDNDDDWTLGVWYRSGGDVFSSSTIGPGTAVNLSIEIPDTVDAVGVFVSNTGAAPDIFHVSWAAPEPGTLAIWSVLGAAGLVIRRRRG